MRPLVSRRNGGGNGENVNVWMEWTKRDDQRNVIKDDRAIKSEMKREEGL